MKSIRELPQAFTAAGAMKNGYCAGQMNAVSQSAATIKKRQEEGSNAVQGQ
jgi:hypothetical protein